jgi:uncharacterized protein (TIGR03435 family)
VSNVIGDCRERASTIGSAVLSIFEAIDRQLGLKLRPEKRLLPVMVVDSISEDVYGTTRSEDLVRTR